MPGQDNLCPCGGPLYRCECECVACVDARQQLVGMPTQCCTRCLQVFPEVAFSRRASGTLQSWCRDCSAAHARERRANRASTGVSTNRAARRSNRGAFDRPFGLEVELIHNDPHALARAMRDAGVECHVEDYNHVTRRHWKIVPDGSVSRGYEVVSPVLRGAEGRREARRAFQAMRDAGATVDRSCGLHVHLEATDMSANAIARVAQLWQQEQGILDGLVAPSRRSAAYHTYCGPVTDESVRAARNAATTYGDRPITRTEARVLGWSRYQTLNLCSYAVHGTLEVRQHQGTLNATKALAWVQLAQALFARAIANPDATAQSGIRGLLTELEEHGLDATVASYLADRHDGFAGQRIAA